MGLAAAGLVAMELVAAGLVVFLCCGRLEILFGYTFLDGVVDGWLLLMRILFGGVVVVVWLKWMPV